MKAVRAGSGLAGQPDCTDPPETVHASAAVIGECGVLIRGASGAGKSSLVLHLVALAERRGLFARLVGDDRVAVSGRENGLVLRPHTKIAGKIEKRWEGVIDAPHEPAARLCCVVDLVADGRDIARMPEEDEMRLSWRGARVPRLALPVTLGSENLALRILDFLAGLKRGAG